MRFKIPYVSAKKGKTDAPVNEKSVLEDRWSTIICLVGIFIVAFFLRSYFALELSTKFGTPFLLTGGSDAYYYERIVEYIAFNNRHLLYDPMINYPIGVTNPRPPFYGWTTVLSAHMFAPFLGGLSRSLHYTLILSTAFWGALTIFPVYMVGRDIFGKRAGMAAAFLLAISAGHLQRSPIGNADHDAIYLFFMITGFYFLMKALRGIPDDVTWVEKWSERASIKNGVSRFTRENKRSLLYAAMAGMCFATVALSWQGWAYVIVIVLTYYYIQLLIDRVRYRDSIGVTFCVMISLVICAMVAAPFYYGAGIGAHLPHRIGTWFDVPLIIIILGLAGGILLTVTRDIPWILVYSTLIAIVITFVIFALYLTPALMDVFLSGAGYFARTKAYETIAEAQAPEFSNIVLSFGPATFFMSMLGIFLAIWHLKGNWNTEFLFILVWTAFAIYMSLSAARFIFNGSPAFALTAGWVAALLVEKSKFQDITYRMARSKGNYFRGLKRAVKPMHIISVLFVVFILLLPNVMSGLDSGIPYERKREYDRQIYMSLPDFMRPEDYNVTRGDVWHFGAFGFGLDKPTDYWPAAWDWLDNKNSHLHPHDRPGFLSWWDYGFESVARGNTPAVADNFLNGHQLAGNLLMAQNESEVISLLIARMLDAPYRQDGRFKGETRAILVHHIGEEKTNELENSYINPEAYREEVLSNPDRYHPRADDISVINLRYARVMGLLAYEEHETLVELYYDLTIHMDKMIQYIAVDTRLFPFSGRQTGIFYAPAKLSDHRMDEEHGMRTPYDFFSIYLIDEFGNEYDDPNDIPPDVMIVDYDIRYHSMFYNSMLYRTFAGYAGHWVGEEESIPAVNNDQLQPMPGWGLNNFKMSYRTAYYNPYPPEEVRDHPDEWRAISFEKGIQLQEEGKGTVDLSAMSYMGQGVVFLEYFHGALVSGTVSLENGAPVPGVRVTILDEMGVPHGTTFTDENGYYTLYAPHGEVMLGVTTGGEGMPVQKLEEVTLGFESFTITREQAMRKPVDRTGDGRWDYLIRKDFQVETSSVNGYVYVDLDDDSEYTPGEDTLVPARITLVNDHFGIELSVDSQDGYFEFTDILPGKYTLNADVDGSTPATLLVEPGEKVTNDLRLRTGSLEGYVTFEDDVTEDIELRATHMVSGNTYTSILDGEGNYSIKHLIYGRYELEVINEEYTIFEGRHIFEVKAGLMEKNNITIGKAVTLEGVTRRGGHTIPHQKLTFTSVSDIEFFPRTVTTDSQGKFHIKMPIGDYRVYGTLRRNHDSYVYMETISLPYHKETLSADFTAAHRFTGSAELDGGRLEELQLLFSRSDGGETTTFTNLNGEFSILLPQGDYSIYGTNLFGVDVLLRSRISIEDDTFTELSAQRGFKLDGVVYRDLDRDGEPGPGEGIPARVTAVFEDDFSITIPAQSDGDYSLVLPFDETVTLTYSKEGFLSKEMNVRHDIDEIMKNVPLQARNVTLSGAIIHRHYDIPDQLPMVLEPVGSGAQHKEVYITQDSYSVSVQPGDYVIRIDHPYGVGEKLYLSREVSLKPGTDMDTDLEVDYKVRFTGNIRDESGEPVEAQLHMKGPEEVMMYAQDTFEVYLIPGAYSLWLDLSEENLVNISLIQVLTPGTHNITLESGATFSPFLTYDGEPRDKIPVWIECLDTGYRLNRTTDIEGTFNVLLPPGNYEVSVDHKVSEPVEGILREMHYQYKETYEVVASTAPVIQLWRDYVNATLTGRITIGGEGIANIELEFIASSPDAISTSVVTGSDGTFTLKLSQGQYYIYTYYSGVRGLYAELNDFVMPDEDEHLDVPLVKANQLTGTVRRSGEGLEADIALRSIDRERIGRRELSTDDKGVYNIILPPGEYGIIASATVKENGLETDYQYAREVDLKYSMEVNLNLEILKIYGVDIHDTDEKTADQGESLTFVVQVENTGNTPDSYTFSAPTAIWKLSFEPSRLDVPSGETRDLRVTVHISEDASVNHPPIEFMAESVNSHETAQMRLPIRIAQHYGVSIEPGIIRRQLDGGKLTYTITVENTGNGDDTYQVEILNREYIRSKGWDTSIGVIAEKITDGALEDIKVTLTPLTRSPDRELELELEVTSKGDPSVYATGSFSIESPSLRSDLHGLNLIGEDISLERDVFGLKAWHWAMIAAVAIVGGFYISRKKRWI